MNVLARWFVSTHPCKCRPLMSAPPQLAITLDDDVIERPLEPVSNYILVKMFAALSKTAGGIVLPDEVS